MLAPGPFVPIDEVEWLPEVSTRETPEDLLLATEDEEEEAMNAHDAATLRAIAADTLKEYLERIPSREALALMVHLGLFGHQPMYQADLAEALDVRSKQVVSYMVCRARVRILYLATRPTVDFDALASVLSPALLEVVREVYETASFTEPARKRWTCPEDRSGKQQHQWTRTHAKRVKRDFFRALAKIDRRPELAEQSAALRHVLGHLGILSHHTGKGSWSR